MVEYVEIGLGEVTAVQLAQQVGHHEMPAARDVDDAAMLLEHPQVASIQDAARFGCERKQAHKRIADAQHRRKLGEALHARQVLLAAAEAGDFKVEREEFLRRICAEHAEAEDADRAVAGEVLLSPPPLAL